MLVLVDGTCFYKLFPLSSVYDTILVAALQPGCGKACIASQHKYEHIQMDRLDRTASFNQLVYGEPGYSCGLAISKWNTEC